MKNNNDIILEVRKGGRIAFEKTGVYAEYLIFSSKKLKRHWRVMAKEKGVLKMNGIVSFYYFFDGGGCKMQSVVDGLLGEEWEIEEIILSMVD